MTIVCLHTAESNIAVFEAAARELGFPDGILRHVVRPELLAAAEQAGGLTPDIASETGSVLLGLARDADAVVLTCSTLGPAAAEAGKAASAPILRADGALAENAVQAGGKIVVLCAVETTMEPTGQLFADAAHQFGATVEVRLVPGAWALFKAGDRDGYLSAIAEAGDAAYDEGASIVALAQASMAGAADLVRKGPKPLRSPTAALAAAAEQLSQKG
ncbi:aspartate/glutamate racemase family protein [Microvirga sp. TS319]|uniref:aspartate/glutamate racemase family protein n=1 Tax=Microvirga sp. TS319 TaxID=3241165 RepID=UPI00351A5EF8